jgi:hypothetical protein
MFIAQSVMLVATTLLLFFGAPLGSFETRAEACGVHDMVESGTLPSPVPGEHDWSPVERVDDEDEDEESAVGLESYELSRPHETRKRRSGPPIALPPSPARDVALPPPR